MTSAHLLMKNSARSSEEVDGLLTLKNISTQMIERKVNDCNNIRIYTSGSSTKEKKEAEDLE